jgi:membrane protein implicated in regulation of membrane protease activity
VLWGIVIASAAPVATAMAAVVMFSMTAPATVAVAMAGPRVPTLVPVGICAPRTARLLGPGLALGTEREAAEELGKRVVVVNATARGMVGVKSLDEVPEGNRGLGWLLRRHVEK